MTAAIALWLARSVSAALWLVEHGVLLLRARRAGVGGALAWLLPSVVRWRAGDRAGPIAWWLFAVVYVSATIAALSLR